MSLGDVREVRLQVSVLLFLLPERLLLESSVEAGCTKPLILAEQICRGRLDAGAAVKVGRAIDVGEAISRSGRILLEQPQIMLPQLIALVPILVNDVFRTSPLLSPLGLVTSILSLVLSVIVGGAYPLLVKAVIEGQKLSLAEALGRAYHRFWSLLGAGILVVLIVVLGAFALVVPGIIFATWYVYTTPAIMLEDKGALDGMAASKAFGRDKKWSTFLIFLTLALFGLLFLVVQSVTSLASPLLGRLVYAVLTVPLGTLSSVIFAYTYLTYGPSPVPTRTGTAGFGMAPPTSPEPAVMGNPSAGVSGSFCRFCGSPVSAGSKFCASCGKAV